MGAGAKLLGYYWTSKRWLPLAVDSSGRVQLDMSNIHLSDLADVDAATPSDDAVLYWDNASSAWKAKLLSFLGLTDTPSSFSGQDGKFVRVNNTEDALEFVGMNGANCQFPNTQAFSGTSPTSWTDLDLSSIVGSNKALVLLKVKCTYTSATDIRFRTNGETDEVLTSTSGSLGTSGLHEVEDSEFGYAFLPTDADGIVEWKAQYARTGVTIDVLGYIVEGDAGLADHGAQHEKGGAQEISVRGLTGASGWEHIETKKLTASAYSIDFTSLSTDYNAFRLTLFLKRQIFGAPMSTGIRFNDDAGANYDFVDMQGNGSSATSTSVSGVSFGVLGSYDDTHLGICFCYVQNAKASIAKEWLTFSGLGTTNIRNINGRWNNTSSKITKISIVPVIGQLYADTVAILEGSRT